MEVGPPFPLQIPTHFTCSLTHTRVHTHTHTHGLWLPFLPTTSTIKYSQVTQLSHHSVKLFGIEELHIYLLSMVICMPVSFFLCSVTRWMSYIPGRTINAMYIHHTYFCILSRDSLLLSHYCQTKLS